jgi:hypothetical protein
VLDIFRIGFLELFAWAGFKLNPPDLSLSLFSVLGFELRTYTSSHITSPFLLRVFGDRGSNYLPGLANR